MPSLDSERPLDGGFQGEDTLPRCKQQRPVFNDNQSVNSRPRWAASRACPGRSSGDKAGRWQPCQKAQPHPWEPERIVVVSAEPCQAGDFPKQKKLSNPTAIQRV